MRLPLPLTAAALTAFVTVSVMATPASANWLLGRPLGSGYQGAWCAVVNDGPEHVSRDCHYGSLQECRSEVIAGNRGFCFENPYYRPRYTQPRKKRAKRVAR